jgi:hypothetical protein
MMWIVFGMLVGSLGTYLLYSDRHRDPEVGALVGAGVGAVGSLVGLIPLWVYVYKQGRRAVYPVVVERPPLERRHVIRLALYALLIFLAIVYLLPIYTVVSTSLKTPKEAGNLSRVWDLPTKVNWNSYQVAMDELGPKLENSFILTISATILSAIMGSMNGYVLSKWKFPGVNIVFPLMLFGMFIPYQSILIPLFQFINNIHLGGSLNGLILTHVIYGLPITTLIFRNYYTEVPTEMLEAGAIDGAGFFGGDHLAVYPDLERVPVCRYPHQSKFSADHSGAGAAGGRRSGQLESPDGRCRFGGASTLSCLHRLGALFHSRFVGRVCQRIIGGSKAGRWIELRFAPCELFHDPSVGGMSMCAMLQNAPGDSGPLN